MMEPLDRAEFLRTAGRIGLLAGLGAVGLALVRKPAAPEGCPTAGDCRRCREYAGCRLRQAKGENQ